MTVLLGTTIVRFRGIVDFGVWNFVTILFLKDISKDGERKKYLNYV